MAQDMPPPSSGSRRERIELLRRLFALFPNTRIADPERTVEGYLTETERYTIETLARTFSLLAESAEFLPSLAAIHTTARAILRADRIEREAARMKALPGVIDMPAETERAIEALRQRMGWSRRDG